MTRHRGLKQSTYHALSSSAFHKYLQTYDPTQGIETKSITFR